MCTCVSAHVGVIHDIVMLVNRPNRRHVILHVQCLLWGLFTNMIINNLNQESVCLLYDHEVTHYRKCTHINMQSMLARLLNRISCTT